MMSKGKVVKKAKRVQTFLCTLFQQEDDPVRDMGDWIGHLTESDLEQLYSLEGNALGIFSWLKALFYGEHKQQKGKKKKASTKVLMAPHQILPLFAWKHLGDLEHAFKTVFLKTPDTKLANVGKIVIGEKMTRYYLREFEVSPVRPTYMFPSVHEFCCDSDNDDDDDANDQPSSQPSNAGASARVFFPASQALSVFMTWLIIKFDLSSEKERKVSILFCLIISIFYS
jgi:hypothetical protein